MRGALVEIIQRALVATNSKDRYYLKEKHIDGIFGKKTRQALKTYQGSNNLTADGLPGKKTWEKLVGIPALFK